MAVKRCVGLVLTICALLTSSGGMCESSTSLAKLPLLPGTSLPLNVSSSGRCMFGDFDLIAADIGSSRNPSLILTVEPLEQGARRALAVANLYDRGAGARIAGKDGYNVELSLPEASSPQLLALYICRDTANTSRCGDKPLIPFREAFAPYSQTRAADFEAKDKIYYFTFLVRAGNEIHFLDKPLSGESLGRLPSQLRALLAKAPDQAVFTRIVASSNTLASEPPARRGDRLGIDLPHVSPERCGQLRK